MSRTGQRTAAEAKYLDVCSRSTHKPEQRFLSALRAKRCEIEIPNEADYVDTVSKVIKDRAATRELEALIVHHAGSVPKHVDSSAGSTKVITQLCSAVAQMLGAVPPAQARRAASKAAASTTAGDSAADESLHSHHSVHSAHPLGSSPCRPVVARAPSHVLSFELSGVELTKPQFETLALGLDGNHSLRQVTLRDLPTLGGNSGAWPRVAAALGGSNVNCLSVVGCDLQGGSDCDAVISLLRRHLRKRDDLLWTKALRGGATGMVASDDGPGGNPSSSPVEAMRSIAATGILVLDLSCNGFDDRAARTLWRQLVHDRWLVALNLKGNAIGAGGVHLLHASYMADAAARLEAVSSMKASSSSSSSSSPSGLLTSPGGAEETKALAESGKEEGGDNAGRRRKTTSKKEAHAAAARKRLAAAAAARRKDARDTEALNLVGLLLDGQAGLATGGGNSAASQVDWLGGGGGGWSGDASGGGDQLRAAVANFRAHVARVRETTMGGTDSSKQSFDDNNYASSGNLPEDEFTHLAEAAVGGSDAVTKYAENCSSADDQGLMSPVAALASNPLLGNVLKRFGVDFDGPSPSPPPLSVPTLASSKNKSTQAHKNHNKTKMNPALVSSAGTQAAVSEVERLCHDFGRLASVANGKGRGGGVGGSTSVVLSKHEFGSVLKEMHVLVARQTLFQGAARAASFFRRAIMEEQLMAWQHLHTLNPGGSGEQVGSKVLLPYLAKQLKLAKQLEHATKAEKAAKAAETSALQAGSPSSSSPSGVGGGPAVVASANAATAAAAAVEAEKAAQEGLNLVLEEAWISEWIKGLVVSSGSTVSLGSGGGSGSSSKTKSSNVGLTALGLSKEMKRVGKAHSLKDYDGSNAIVQKVQTFLGFANKSTSGAYEVASAAASASGGEPPPSLAAHALASGLSRAVNHAATLRQASDLDAVLLLVDTAVEHYMSASDPASSRHALAASRLFDEWFGAPAARRRRAEQLQEEASAAAAQADLAAAQAASASSSSSSSNQEDSSRNGEAGGDANFPKKSLLKAFGGGVSSGGQGGGGLLAKMKAAGKLTILANRMRTDAMAAQARAAAAASRAHFDRKSNSAGGGAQAVNVAQVSDLARALWTVPLPQAIGSGKAAGKTATASAETGRSAATTAVAAPLVTLDSWQWARARGVVLESHRISQAAAKLRSSRGQSHQEQRPSSLKKKHAIDVGPSTLKSSLPLQISAQVPSTAARVANMSAAIMAPGKSAVEHDTSSSCHFDNPATVLTPPAVLLYAPTHHESKFSNSSGGAILPSSSSTSLMPPPPPTDAAAPKAKVPSSEELALRVFVWRLACLATSSSDEAQALAAHLATMKPDAEITDQASQNRAGTFLKQVGRMSISEFEKALRHLRRAVSPTAQAERQQAARLCVAVYGAVCARSGVDLMGAATEEKGTDGGNGGDEKLRGSALTCARQWCAHVIPQAAGGENAQPFATPSLSPLGSTAILDRASLHKSLRDLFPRGSLAPHVDDLVRAVNILLGKDKAVVPGATKAASRDSKSCTTRDLLSALEVARDWSSVLERQEEEVQWCREVLADVDHLAASQRWRARDLFQALQASHVAAAASSSSVAHRHGSRQHSHSHHHHSDDASLSPLALEAALRRWGVGSSLNGSTRDRDSDQDEWGGDHDDDDDDAADHVLGSGSNHERFTAQGSARTGVRRGGGSVGGHAGGDFAAWIPLDSTLDTRGGAAAAAAAASVTAESCEGEAWLRQFVLEPYQHKLAARKASLQHSSSQQQHNKASGPSTAIPLGLTALAIRSSSRGSHGRPMSSSFSTPNAITPVSLEAFAIAVRTLRRVLGPESSSFARSQRHGSVVKAWVRGAQAVGALDAAGGGSGGVGAVSNATMGTALSNALDLFAAAIAALPESGGQDAAVSAAIRQGSSLAHVVVLGLGQLRYRQALAHLLQAAPTKNGSHEDYSSNSNDGSGGSGTSGVLAFVVPTAVEDVIAQILAAASDVANAPGNRDSLRQDGAIAAGSDDGSDSYHHHQKSSPGAMWQQQARDLVMYVALCFRGGLSDVHALLDLARGGADRVALLEEELNAFDATMRHYHWRLADLFHRAALLSGPETAGASSTADAESEMHSHGNLQEGSGSPSSVNPVPMPPSAFNIPPSAAGGNSGQRISSNRGLTSSFASATQPQQVPGNVSDRVPDDRAMYLNKFAAETVVAKGQLDALLSSLGFFHHAAPHPMPSSAVLPQPHSEGPLTPVPFNQGPSRPSFSQRGAMSQTTGSKADGPSKTTSGSSSSSSREEDALLADLEWKVEHLSKVVSSMEEHKNASTGTRSHRSCGESNSRSASDDGRHSSASSGQSFGDEDPEQECVHEEPLYSALATTTATMAMTDGGRSSSGMLDVTGLSEEGGEEDTALMEQLAAALSQRIKTIYDV